MHGEHGAGVHRSAGRDMTAIFFTNPGLPEPVRKSVRDPGSKEAAPPLSPAVPLPPEATA